MLTEIVLECVTRMMNNMVPVSISTIDNFFQPLEVLKGKQCIAQ